MHIVNNAKRKTGKSKANSNRFAKSINANGKTVKE